MILSMPVLPDCDACDSAVVVDVGEDGAWERCVGCGIEQRPMPSYCGIPLAVRVVAELARVGGLEPVLCRACDRGEHGRCWRVRCTCDHPEVP